MLTVWSSAIWINEGSLIIDMIGIVNAYDPPMMIGRRVPNKVWSVVFMPVTKSMVCITCALSCWKQTNRKKYQSGWTHWETVHKQYTIIQKDELWIHASDAILWTHYHGTRLTYFWTSKILDGTGDMLLAINIKAIDSITLNTTRYVVKLHILNMKWK